MGLPVATVASLRAYICLAVAVSTASLVLGKGEASINHMHADVLVAESQTLEANPVSTSTLVKESEDQYATGDNNYGCDEDNGCWYAGAYCYSGGSWSDNRTESGRDNRGCGYYDTVGACC